MLLIAFHRTFPFTFTVALQPVVIRNASTASVSPASHGYHPGEANSRCGPHILVVKLRIEHSSVLF